MVKSCVYLFAAHSHGGCVQERAGGVYSVRFSACRLMLCDKAMIVYETDGLFLSKSRSRVSRFIGGSVCLERCEGYCCTAVDTYRTQGTMTTARSQRRHNPQHDFE